MSKLIVPKLVVPKQQIHMPSFMHLHAHSCYSVNDALPSVPEMVSRAAELGQPGMALSDHGVMGGTWQLYRECLDHGLKPFPGVELYYVENVETAREHKDRRRWHMGAIALDLTGYKQLVKLVSRSWQNDRKYYRPLVDWNDLSAISEEDGGCHIAWTTGCFFGLAIQTLVNKSETEATAIVRMLANLFPNTTYVELQDHGNKHDAVWSDTEIVAAMYGIAQELGLPVLITGDCHMLLPEHHEAHSFMKELAYQGDPGEDSFPGEDYSVASAATIEARFHGHLGDTALKIFNESELSYQQLLSSNTLHIPQLHAENYRFLMPSVPTEGDDTSSSDVRLRKLAKAGLKARWNNAANLIEAAQHNEYLARLKDEWEVIRDTGFADYFLAVADVCEYARTNEIRIQARGSANGSLLLWALNVTDIDPIRWKIPFGTFISRDRTKPPDVDLDTQTFKRQLIVDYINSRYSSVQQSTPNRWSLNPEFDEEGIGGERTKGSLFQAWFTARRRQLSPAEFMVRFGRFNAKEAKPEEIGQRDPQGWRLLQALHEVQPWRSYGAHAAGFVLDPQGDVSLHSMVPTMTIGSGKDGRTVTQMTMDDLEGAGYVKFDVLGLVLLEALDVTRKLLGWSWDDFDAIPLDDAAVYREIGIGRTSNAVFQLGGYSVAKVLRAMAPKTIHEVIDGISLSRPGVPGDAVAGYMTNRREPSRMTFPHEVARQALTPTWGVMVYTEQVLEICAAVGLSTEVTQKILQAMKVKHSKKGYNAKSEAAFKSAKEQFYAACQQTGVGKAATGVMWEQIFSFNRYAFKLAHATPYGILGYKSAWLRYYYPREFMCGVLQVVNQKGQLPKEKEYTLAARICKMPGTEDNLVIHEPKVQPGEPVTATWSVVPDGLQRGVGSIRGIGGSAASQLAQGGPYANLEDLRGNATGWTGWDKGGVFTGTMLALQNAKALTPLGLKPGDVRHWPSIKVKVPRRRVLKVSLKAGMLARLQARASDKHYTIKEEA